ncbi:YciI family protein [Listeria monocytogenes]|nr:GTP cyclohydrolase [Listeria monocytogenes]EAC3953012.1 GTP cyclohydrolase [Listeria monocytogenes]EAC9555221.1 GTP cyclohydrolase [Listeria monocytogenes]EAD0532561.1 GTP cyclohydrolase [Listeria monocytogenes]EAE1964017.1 GTP cyclohydrolase [Listeria monocytogenes]
MYILNLTYKKSLEEVNRHLSAHNEYLQTYYIQGNFICSGRKEPRSGGIILANFQSLNEVKEAIKEDPFLQNEIADYQITEFIPTKSAEVFHSLLE